MTKLDESTGLPPHENCIAELYKFMCDIIQI